MLCSQLRTSIVSNILNSTPAPVVCPLNVESTWNSWALSSWHRGLVTNHLILSTYKTLQMRFHLVLTISLYYFLVGTLKQLQDNLYTYTPIPLQSQRVPSKNSRVSNSRGFTVGYIRSHRGITMKVRIVKESLYLSFFFCPPRESHDLLPHRYEAHSNRRGRWETARSIKEI